MQAAWANYLSVGKAAKSQNPILIPINPMVELDWKSRDEVLGMREKLVNKFPQLLGEDYIPGECFDMIEDNRPWWGLWGLHVYRQGQRSIDGPSKESDYLLNPFRIVATEPNNIGIFKTNSLTTKDLSSPDFPFVWKSGPVRFDARNAMAMVTYDITGYHKQLARWIPKLVADTVIQDFSFIAYNARDFGLPYMWLDPAKSINVRAWQRKDPVEIPQMIHCGGSCGYPGGCNNMSPHRVEFDNNRIQKLPARAYIKLFKEMQRDPNTAKR
jgi:hypothetical protein